MDIEKRLMEYYKRWNLDFPYEEQFLMFKNRIVTLINELAEEILLGKNDIDESFLKVVEFHQAKEPMVKKSRFKPTHQRGEIPDDWNDIFISAKTEKGFGDTNVYQAIISAETPQELAFIIQALFWSLEEHKEGKELIPQLVERVRGLAALTPSISFNIVNRGEEVIIYPHGDEFLDKEIVDYVIFGLEKHPNAAKPFCQALKIYQSGDTAQYRNLLDSLRLALEQLLKNILSNEKRGIEKQKNELKEWMSEKKLHSNISTLYGKLLNDYTHYQNDAVKHDEKYSLDEVEFMIYLTATFMRLIIQLQIEQQQK